jgi:hypothetical protein
MSYVVFSVDVSLLGDMRGAENEVTAIGVEALSLEDLYLTRVMVHRASGKRRHCLF